MAESLETAASITDSDIDDIVSALEGTDSNVTETPASDSPAPASDDAPKALDEIDGQGSGEEEEQDEVAALEPNVSAVAVPAVSADPAVPAAPLPPTPAGKPFQFRATGGVHTLPGALELADGSIVIPKDAQADFRARLASERELATNFKALRREMSQKLTAAQRSNEDGKAEADALAALVGDLEKKTPDELFEWAENFVSEVPKMKLEIEKQKLVRERAALHEERNPTPTDEEAGEARQAALQSELRQTYARVMEHPSVKGLDPADVHAVFRKHAARAERLVSKDPDGSEMFDDAEVLEDLENLVAIAARVRAVAAPAPAMSARERNDARNADLNAIPPVVAARPPAPTARKVEKAFQGGSADFKKAFMTGKLDDDE